MTDLDDTSRCPLGHRCESCGTTGDDLTVSTATTALGVLCLTMCARCTEAGGSPRITIGTAQRFVLQHAGHLGVDLDEMAAAMDLEEDR